MHTVLAMDVAFQPVYAHFATRLATGRCVICSRTSFRNVLFRATIGGIYALLRRASRFVEGLSRANNYCCAGELSHGCTQSGLSFSFCSLVPLLVLLFSFICCVCISSLSARVVRRLMRGVVTTMHLMVAVLAGDKDETPQSSPSLLQQGVDALNKGALTLSRSLFHRAIEVQPFLPNGYIGLAEAYLHPAGTISAL
jgi:hypothetical protein